VSQNRVNIKNANIFLFNGNGTLADSRYVANIASTSNVMQGNAGELFDDEDKITSSITKIVIVANSGTIIGGVDSETSLNAVIRTLTQVQQAYNPGSLSDGSIWSYGTASIAGADWGVVNDVLTASVVVSEINPIVARVDLNIDLIQAANFIGGQTTVGNTSIAMTVPAAGSEHNYVEFEGVAVLYSSAFMHFTPNFNPTLAQIAALPSTDPALTSGLMPASGDLWDVTPHATSKLFGDGTAANILFQPWGGQWNTADVLTKTNQAVSNFSRSFYVLPTNEQYAGASAAGRKANPVITLYGKKYVWNATTEEYAVTRVFWPLHFNDQVNPEGDIEKANMENGMIYKVNFTMKGDLVDSGVTDPETTDPTNVIVTIDQAKWKGTVTINQPFGE
jgi:hypothetical protein